MGKGARTFTSGHITRTKPDTRRTRDIEFTRTKSDDPVRAPFLHVDSYKLGFIKYRQSRYRLAEGR